VALLNEIAQLQFNMTQVSRALHRLQLASIQPTNIDLLRARLVEVRRTKRQLQSKLTARTDGSRGSPPQNLHSPAPRKHSTHGTHGKHGKHNEHNRHSTNSTRGKRISKTTANAASSTAVNKKKQKQP